MISLGLYKCVVSNPVGTTATTATLKVDHTMQVPEFIHGFSNLTTYEGEQVRFEVEVRGDPPPSISWYRDGEVIRDSPDFQVKKDLFFNKNFDFFSSRSLRKEIVVYFLSPKSLWKIKVYLLVRLLIQLDHLIVQLVLLLNPDHNFNFNKEIIFMQFPGFFHTFFFAFLHFCNACCIT
jgi:hypothetical protein